MDMDVGNLKALQAGAEYHRTMGQSQGWLPISQAPRDGTIIEVRCTYGVAPWYGLYRWTSNTKFIGQDGKLFDVVMAPRWAKVGDDSSGFTEGPTFTWRPYTRDPSAYSDPTGGLQNSAAYWRGAAAQERGLPIDYFENSVGAAPTPKKPSVTGFFKWLFGH